MLSVYNRQRNLRTHCGYYSGKLDGIEGTGTKTAYKNFQRDNGLTVDGKYGSETDSKLILVIKNLQSLLNKYGYKLDVDGIAGDKTINAIVDFQRNHGLVADGIAGAKTYAVLNGGQPSPSPSHYTCKYFKDSEFTCKCGCGTNFQKNGIKKVMDNIREHFGKPIIVTSGTRCRTHNARVGGVSNSYHLYGNACDFVVDGVSSAKVMQYINQLKAQGLVRYAYSITSSATHVDTGGLE